MTLLAIAEEGGFNPLDVETGLYVWTTIAFLVVLFFLAKRVFPKLQEGLADREQRIKADLERAEETRLDAERVLEDYKSRVAHAREEANGIVDEARQAAETVRADLIQRAEGDARLIVDKAQKELAGERDRTMAELQTQLASWSTQIASQIVQKELTADSQRDLVDAFIRDVQSKEA
ncbi:MAG: F0F1 ATP synthase subunit B [Actinomycetota bacterium]